jgi:hypothetical protein
MTNQARIKNIESTVRNELNTVGRTKRNRQSLRQMLKLRRELKKEAA